MWILYPYSDGIICSKALLTFYISHNSVMVLLIPAVVSRREKGERMDEEKKELTRVITVELTTTDRIKAGEYPNIPNAKEVSAIIRKHLPGKLDIDDANVIGVQDFIRDLD